MVRSGSRGGLVVLTTLVGALGAAPLACSSDGGTAAGTSPSAPAASTSEPSPPAPAEDAAVSPDASDASVTAKSSGGSGGLPCARRDDLGGGRSVCVTKVGSVELKILEPSGGAGPVRIGLYLHGDGAGAYKSASAIKAMIAWADAKHALAVAALAPNGCAWWQSPSHDCASSTSDVDVNAENAAALSAAFTAIEKGWDVRDDGRYYYGSSGGSIFLTDEWIPLQGGTRPGVLALMCGGEVSTRAYAWNAKNAAARARDRLFFTYGDQDFLLSDIEGAMKDFEARGFSVTKKVIAGATHCAFDAHGEAVAIWNAN